MARSRLCPAEGGQSNALPEPDHHTWVPDGTSAGSITRRPGRFATYASPLWIPEPLSGYGVPARIRRPRRPLPVDPPGVALAVAPPRDGPLARLEHPRDQPAEFLLADHVDVLREVGRHQRPAPIGLTRARRVVVGQAERVPVLVRDHARIGDRCLRVDVVRPDSRVHGDP